MSRRTPPYKNYPEWTEARFWGFIRSALRQASSKYPVKYQVLQNNRRVYKGPDKRTKWEHKCNSCKQWFKQKDIQVDHIVEAGRLSTYDDLPGFVERLFPSLSGYQKLCKPCHSKKSKETRDGKDSN